MLPIVYTPTVGHGDRAVQPRVPPPPRGVPVRRPPRGRRGVAAQLRAWAPTTSTCSSPPTPRASSASATRASAASRSRSASSPSTPPRPGIHPRRVIPVVLDMGTDNLALLNDEMYLGNRHARVRDQRYDDLIDAYVTRRHEAVPARDAALGGLRRQQRPPHPEQVRRPGLHVQRRHAGHRRGGAGRRVLRRPRGRHPRCATSGSSSTAPGTAGLGIADMMRDRDGPRRACPARRPRGGSGRWAARACSSTTRRSLRDFQVPYARPAAEVAGWSADGRRRSGSPTSSRNVRPDHADRHLDPGRRVHRADRRGRWPRTVDRPIIMPLSNPTSKCEALPDGPDRAGPTAGPWSRPAARSPPVDLRRRHLPASPRPTTPSSSPASGSA